LAGKACAPGTFLTGFGASGQLSCNAIVAPGNPPVVTNVLAAPTTPLTGQVVTMFISALDLDGDPLFFETRFLSVPQQSHAQLTQVFSPRPAFVPDVPGPYVIAAVAIDPAGHRSQPYEIDVLAIPCGSATPFLSVTAILDPPPAVGRPVQLQVLAVDPNAACGLVPLALDSKFASVPPLGQVQVIGASTTTPSFIPNVPGDYSLLVTATNSLGLKSEQVLTVSVQ
jgi:hypothetical protein